MKRTQITLYLENKPGALARATKALAAARVNIEGIAVAGSTDAGLVRLVVKDAGSARKALNKAKVPHATAAVSVLPLRNEPGALARVAAKLAAAHVNINDIYGTVCDCGCDCTCLLVVSADDLKKVEALWKA